MPEKVLDEGTDSSVELPSHKRKTDQPDPDISAKRRSRSLSRVKDGVDGPTEFTCPLCLKLLFRPVRTPCQHIYCQPCLTQWLRFDELASRSRKPCPLCRAPLARKILKFVDQELESRMRRDYGSLYEERQREVLEEESERQKVLTVYRKLQIGNSEQYIEPAGGSMNAHRWSFFVRMGGIDDIGDYIERVTVTLHPTFHPPVVVLRRPPFCVQRVGWGVFRIGAIIKVKAPWRLGPSCGGGDEMSVGWMLTFDGGGVSEVELELIRNAQDTAENCSSVHPAPSLRSARNSFRRRAAIGASMSATPVANNHIDDTPSTDEAEVSQDESNASDRSDADRS
ncbi:hypothetical protein BC832DRAFT_589642 [Gaertneriomyces semiglobifer]|nr:hypothetical protein BC832DRAFT_589642 [Gaertneriomyces semiglobifer]